jgi:hypothetical protein
MITKRKYYTTVEKLKIVRGVQNFESKAGLFCVCGIPEGTVCSSVPEYLNLSNLSLLHALRQQVEISEFL